MTSTSSSTTKATTGSADAAAAMTAQNLRTEPLMVLYGSQMGNSEQAAKEFCRQLDVRYTPDYFRSVGLSPIRVETTCIQLDDFLEIHHAAYTKVLIIFVSSYGVGQAPLGAYRFRSLTEALLLDDGSGSGQKKILQGLRYAICGLGDSGYSTYLKNPRTIDKGLTAAGAVRIGEMAKADAKQIGETSQEMVIANWIDGLWIPLAKVLAAQDGGSPSVSDSALKQMQAHTIPILVRLDSDYTPPPKALKEGGKEGSLPAINYIAGVAIALIALLAATILKTSGVKE